MSPSTTPGPYATPLISSKGVPRHEQEARETERAQSTGSVDMTISADDIIEHIHADLAECEKMIALGVARPVTAEHVDIIRALLASFPAREPPDLARIKVLARGERGREWGNA